MAFTDQNAQLTVAVTVTVTKTVSVPPGASAATYRRAAIAALVDDSSGWEIDWSSEEDHRIDEVIDPERGSLMEDTPIGVAEQLAARGLSLSGLTPIPACPAR